MEIKNVPKHSGHFLLQWIAGIGKPKIPEPFASPTFY